MMIQWHGWKFTKETASKESVFNIAIHTHPVKYGHFQRRHPMFRPSLAGVCVCVRPEVCLSVQMARCFTGECVITQQNALIQVFPSGPNCPHIVQSCGSLGFSEGWRLLSCAPLWNSKYPAPENWAPSLSLSPPLSLSLLRTGTDEGMCVRKREEKVSVSEKKREWVGEWARVCVCACVCERERECTVCACIYLRIYTFPQVHKSRQIFQGVIVGKASKCLAVSPLVMEPTWAHLSPRGHTHHRGPASQWGAP